MTPEARKDGLLVQVVGDETIVYDQPRNHAHRLNRTAALVWGACNGARTIAELTEVVQQELGHAVGQDMVLLALSRLDKGRLLLEPLALPADSRFVTRRDMLRRAALVGGMTLLIPVVQSMVAPTPAMAMSLSGACAQNGQSFMAGRPCCPGLQPNLATGLCGGRS